MEQQIILSLRNISKFFPGVKALDDVSLDFYEGEVHAIVGENGAGKSTLMKILSGVYTLDAGEVWLNGEKVYIKNPLDALEKGQSIIYQEFNLINALSITENIYLGRLSNKSGTWIDWKLMNKKAEELMERLGYKINPTTLIKELSVAEKQMVEICKALSYNSRIIIMDEPTATLTSNETKHLFGIINELRADGVTVIYISHKLEEVVELSNRITVMRDGRIISTQNTSDISREDIIEKMVGRTIDTEYPKRSTIPDSEIVMEVKNLKKEGVFEDISFSLYKREVLGLAGLVGSGRTEIVRGIFGADSLDSGSVEVHGKKVNIKTPADSIKNKIAFLTEDRKAQGLLLSLPLSKNISLANLEKVTHSLFINHTEEKIVCSDYVNLLSIKTPSTEQIALNLSGGNQQKVVFAKWLYANSDIIILDEPTRGIDVGAKVEIYNLINKLVEEGKSIIMISSELPELLAMSDRVLVIYEGRLKGVLTGDDISAENVMMKIIN